MTNCSKMPLMHGRWLATSSGGPLRKSTTRSLPSSFRTDEVTTRPARKKFSVLRPTSGSAHLLSARIAVAFVVPRFAVPKSRRLTHQSQLPLPLIQSPSSHGVRRKTPEYSSLLACAARLAATQPFGYRIVRQPGSEASPPHAAPASEYAFMTFGSAVRRQSPFHPGAADAFPIACRVRRLLAFAQPQRVEESQPRGHA